MSEHGMVENVFARERAAGRMTRGDGAILRRRLAMLALNMTLAGSEGEVPKTAAAVWMIHVQRRRIGPLPRDIEEVRMRWGYYGYYDKKWPVLPVASARVLARAERWFTLAAGMDILRVTEEAVAFVDGATREYFCCDFLQTHPLNSDLLRLAARPVYAPAWRQWAREDVTLVDRLLILLREAPEVRTRTRAATVLGFISDPRARDPLMAAHGDASTAVRIAATGALAAYGDPDLTEQLARELAQEINALHAPFAVALGEAGEPSVPALLALLEHRDWLVARAAVIGLGWTHSPQAAAALIAPPATISSDSGHVVEALVRLGDAALPTLLAAYNDERKSVAKRSGAALSRLGYVSASAALLELLRYRCRREPGGRFPDLGRAFIQQCTLDTAFRYREALSDPYSEVRLYAATALAERHDEAAFAPLMSLLRHHDRQTRNSAVVALGRVGDRHAVEPLIAILEQAQAKTLPALPDPRTVKPGSDTRVRFAAMMANIQNKADRHVVIEALGRLGDRRATAPLLRELEQADDHWEGYATVTALGRIGDPAAIEPLLSLIGKAPGRGLDHFVITALACIVDPRALDGLRRLQPRFPPHTYLGSQIARAIRQLSNQLSQQ